MGGGDDAPSAPDYSELIDILKPMAEWSMANAKEMKTFFTELFGKNSKVSDIVIDKALGEMDKLIADADRARQRYQNIYEPLEEQQAHEAQSYSSAARQEMEAGKAEADVAAQFEQARSAAQDRLESFGVDPSSTRQQAMDLGTRVAEAAAQASAGNQARAATAEIGRQLTGQAIQTGSALPGRTAAQAALGAQMGNQAVNTGLAQTASGAQTLGTAPQWTQIGTGTTGTWGNILNAGFQNELDAWKANQSQSSGIGTALGAAASFIPLFLQEGGAIPEEEGRPVPVEASPSAGAIPDDIPAEIDGGPPARLSAGEFVMPKDVVSWLGEKGLQGIVLKARKEMAGGNGERPAQPTSAPPPMSVAGAGAIPG